MNSKILETSELKKLDKLEKVIVQELHNTEKGEFGSTTSSRDESCQLTLNIR